LKDGEALVIGAPDITGGLAVREQAKIRIVDIWRDSWRAHNLEDWMNVIQPAYVVRLQQSRGFLVGAIW
jgi:hypothetical protein